MGKDPDAIREEIEQTRAEMTETVEAIGYKADVPSRAKEKLSEKVDSVKSKVCDSCEWFTSDTNAWYSKAPEYARRMERFVMPTLRLRLPTGTQRMRGSVVSGVAYQAKLAIANAGSFKSLEDTFLSTIEALANALEAGLDAVQHDVRVVAVRARAEVPIPPLRVDAPHDLDVVPWRHRESVVRRSRLTLTSSVARIFARALLPALMLAAICSRKDVSIEANFLSSSLRRPSWLYTTPVAWVIWLMNC